MADPPTPWVVRSVSLRAFSSEFGAPFTRNGSHYALSFTVEHLCDANMCTMRGVVVLTRASAGAQVGVEG